MTTTTSALPARLVLATLLVSLVALGVGTFALLRPPAAPAPAASNDLDALRKELAELRHSLDVTRNQQVAPDRGTVITDVEQRLSRIEARLAAAPTTAPNTAPQPGTDGSAGTPAVTPVTNPAVKPGEARTVAGLDFDAEGRLVVPAPK